MKAEHRKELQTNLLADRLGRLVKGVRSGPLSMGAIVWTVIILVALVGAIWLFNRGGSSSGSDAWVRLDGNEDPAALQRIADDHPGTSVGRAARLERARILLAHGLAGICPDDRATPEDKTKERDRAIQDLEDTRDVFRTLASEAGSDPLLAQEAFVGAAKAEEALVQVPKADKPGEFRGDLGQALTFYQDALKTLPSDNPLAETIAKHVKELEKGGKEFYTELNRIAEAESKRAK